MRVAVLAMVWSWASVSALAADTLEMKVDDRVYRISSTTGHLEGAARDGKPFLSASKDLYILFTRDCDKGREVGEETDQVFEVKRSPDGLKTILRCRNDSLGMSVRKVYRIEKESGFLFKRTEIQAAPGTVGYVIVESGLSVPGAWWRDAVLWQPLWHSPNYTFYPTQTIRDETNLAPCNGTRQVVMLYRPKENDTLVHFRWGGATYEFFDTFPEWPPYGKRVWPGQWRLGVGNGFVAAEPRRELVCEVAFGIMPTSPLGFYLNYRNRPEYQELTTDRFIRTPSWVREIILDDGWDTSYLPRGFKEMFAAALRYKFHFGYINSTCWGKFPLEYYLAKPEQTEPGCQEDPADTVKFIAEMQRLHPRFKVGLYTHFGGISAKAGSRLAKLAEEKSWLTHRKDGTVVTHATDYAMTNPKAAVSMTRAAQGYREFLNNRWNELLDNLNPDFLYADAAPCGGGHSEMDWQTLTSPTGRTIQDLYAGFLDRAAERGKAFWMNYPIGIGNSGGYLEFPWFSHYQADWRLMAGRIIQVQALNVPGRRIALVGQIITSGNIAADDFRTVLNAMTLYGTIISMLELKSDGSRQTLLAQGPPYIQAAYEIRNRELVDAAVTPNWWTRKTQTEAHAWKSEDGYGLISLMSHRPKPFKETIAFDTAPLGLTSGKPAFIWRLEMRDPRHVDFGPDNATSPVRRLADQQLLRVENKLPERIRIETEMSPENPVCLLVTHNPAGVVSVEGKINQYWIPSAYGVVARGTYDPAQGKMNLTVENPKQQAEVLLALPLHKQGSKAIKQRIWSDTHAAGVAAGFSEPKFEPVTIDNHPFIKVQVPKGSVEYSLD